MTAWFMRDCVNKTTIGPLELLYKQALPVADGEQQHQHNVSHFRKSNFLPKSPLIWFLMIIANMVPLPLQGLVKVWPFDHICTVSHYREKYKNCCFCDRLLTFAEIAHGKREEILKRLRQWPYSRSSTKNVPLYPILIVVKIKSIFPEWNYSDSKHLWCTDCHRWDEMDSENNGQKINYLICFAWMSDRNSYRGEWM